AGQPDTNCTGVLACDGHGVCKSGVSGICLDGLGCLSGFCADGVCCDSICSGVCQACALTGMVGTCANVPAGQSDALTCEAPNACSASATCQAPRGATCQNNTDCISDSCVDGVCC